MENKIVLLDTSVLIDYYRKKDKSKSVLLQLYNTHQTFTVSTITEYEIYVGADANQVLFWDDFFLRLIVLPFDTKTSKLAASLSRELRSINKLIEIPDLFIAATAITHNLPCATLNKKHFERIKDLKLVEY